MIMRVMVLKLFHSNKSNMKLSVATLVLFFFGLLFAGLMTMPGANAALSVTLNPTSGPPGTTVHIYASGFTPNGNIPTKLWNGTESGTFTADSNGVVNTTVVVPDVQPGLYGFTVTDASSGSTTQTQFTVTQSGSSPTPTPKATVPEFSSFLVVLPMLIALSVAAASMARKAKQSTLRA